MAKRKFLLMSVALLVLGAVQLHAAKELKLVARYNYSPDGQLQSVLTPVSDNGAVKTSYSRSYLSDGKVKVTVHKKNLEFNELAFSPVNGQGLALVAPADDRGSRSESERSLAFSSPSHDYNEALALYQVAAKGNIAPSGVDKGILVREYVEKAGRKLEETNMLGNTNVFSYNNKGQLVKVFSFGEGNEDNGQGRALVAPADDSETSFFYDKLGRLVKTEDALGRVSRRVYNIEDRVTEIINPLDEKSFLNYDKDGRVVSKSGAGTYPLSFEYNSFGETTSYTDTNGAKTNFECENSGRLGRRIWPDGTTVSYFYNEKGLPTKTLEGDRTIIYYYGDFNRLTKIEIYQGAQKSVTLLKYDYNGQLVEISNENGKNEFAYDSFGRMTSEKGQVGTIEYKYDSAGRLSEKICVLSGSLKSGISDSKFSTKYSYDNFDRIIQISSPADTYSYTYDDKGRIASLSFGDVMVKNEYDKAGRLVSKSLFPAVNGERSTENGTLLCAYEYDKLDRRVKAEVNGIKWSYGYDEYNQLTSASSSGGYNYRYGFDHIGNRRYSTLVASSTTEIKTEYNYNNLNQIANNGYKYDPYGNLIQAQGIEYKYDLHNRLTEVKKADATVKYFYDAIGQRIKSEEITHLDTISTGSGQAKITYYLMSGMIEQARVADTVAQYHTLGLDLTQSLTVDGGVGAVLASSKLKTEILTPETFNYLYDGNGNVISTCSRKGEITAKIAYSPFGEKLNESDLPFTFSTKPIDKSGLSYYGYRFYNPVLGRWIMRDPIGEQGGDNIYCFVSNNAINIRDLFGLTFIDKGKTGSSQIWFPPVGGSGGRGGQNTGSWQKKVDPEYESQGCKCWVKEGTGLVTVERSYTGVEAGIQGTLTTRQENRGGGVIVTVYSMPFYFTIAAVQGVDLHEKDHIDASETIYNGTIKLAEDQVNAHRQPTPYVTKDCIFFCGTKCINELKSLIDWDNRFQSFYTQDVAMNAPGGTLDSNPSNIYIKNRGKIAWVKGENEEYEALDFYDGK